MNRWLLVGLLATSLAACGHKAAPIPPTPRVPMRPQEVSWHQRGDQLEIRASYDLHRKGGADLHGVARPVVLALLTPTADLAKGWETVSRDREFERQAQVFVLPPFDNKTHGHQFSRTENLPLTSFGDTTGVVLALAVEDQRGRSMSTPRKVLLPIRPALEAPGGALVTAEEQNLRIGWEAPADSRVDRVKIFRRLIPPPADAQDPPGPEEASLENTRAKSPWKNIATVSDEEGFLLDTEARYGQEFEYALTCTTRSPGIPVESEMVLLPAFLYRDLFPPLPAQDLKAVVERDKIRVLWFPGGSSDEQMCIVEREREGQGDDESTWVEIGRVQIPDADFVDTTAEKLVRYRYRVFSVDNSGNRAAASEISAWVMIRPRDRPGGESRGDD